MKPNQFYIFPTENRKEFLLDCVEHCDKVWVDELDCSKSFTRQPTEKSWEEVLDIGISLKNTHYTFIYRDGYHIPDYFETGLSTIGNETNYFLWINLSVPKGLEIIEKYQLKEL